MTIIDRLGRTVGSILPNASESDPSANIAIKTPVRVATTANIVLNGLLMIDGVTVAAGDRVLVRSQSDQTQNGIYAASSGNWHRTTDFDDLGEVIRGTLVFVNEGTQNGGKTSYVTSDDPITPDTTDITFSVPGAGGAGKAFLIDSRASATLATFSADINSVVTCGYATAGDGGGAVYKRGAGSGSFADANAITWSLDLSRGAVNPRWFGAKGDGITDDTTAVQAAMTASAGGKELHFPAGTYGVSSALFGGAGNISITGASNHRSIIKVLGSVSLDPLLQFVDASDVTIDGISFLGNNVTTGVGALLFNATTGSGAIGGHHIRNCRFSNFKAWYWIRFLTSTGSGSQTKTIRYIRIKDNDFFSLSGNAPDFTSIGVASNMIDLQGSVDNNASLIDDVIISGNYADCGNVKVFAGSWAGANNVLIKDNFILNAGSAGQNDRGCYGLLVYNNHGTADVTYSPTDVTIEDNTIIAARSMGVYGATATRLQVLRNKISGVQDTTAASLPYAAISLGQCADSKVCDNDLVDNYVSIQLIPTAASITAEASRNRIRSSVNSATGIISTTLSSFVNKVKISDNTILLPGTTTNGISCNSGGVGAEFDTVDIINNRVFSTGTPISCLNNSGGGIKANMVTVAGNIVDGAFATIGIELEQSSARLVLLDNTINLSSAGSSAIGIKLDSSTVIQIDGLILLNRTTGSAFAFSASSATGTIRNVTFSNIARANLPADASGHLGFQVPTFSGLIAWFVQNLSTTFYTEAGAASSKYTVDGWVNTSGSTTWLPKRLLTGN